MTTTVRHKNGYRVVRTTFGQVAEYDVYDDDGNWLGGGTKQEALALYRKLSGKS